MATPTDPRLQPNTAGVRAAEPLGALEAELQGAVDQIERGECSVLSVEDVDRWAETGVPPWSDDFPG